MTTVTWRPQAQEDLFEIQMYLDEHSLSAADQLEEDIERAIAALPQYPYIGRAGRVLDTRELVINPRYVVVYRVFTTVIEIVAVLHTRQQYP